MEQLIIKLGIDWRLLLAQAVNFAILVYVLQRFAFKPLMKSLRARQEQIALSVKRAEEVDEKLKEAESLKHDILERARKEGDGKIKDAVKTAARLKDEKIAEAETEAQKIVARGTEKLEKERIALTIELKKEMGELVAAAVERTMGDVLDDKAQKKLSDEALAVIRS